MRQTSALLLILFTFLAACGSTTPIGPAPQDPVDVDRQAQLTRLFDRMTRNDAHSAAAAKEAAAGDERDLRFLSSLWGTRSSEPACASGLARALSDTGKHPESLVWYQRAFLALGEDDERRPYVRLELARQYVAVGRKDEAFNLLTTRLSLEPLPDELKPRYDELIEATSR